MNGLGMNSMENTQDTEYSSDSEDVGTKGNLGGLSRLNFEDILDVGRMELPSIPDAAAELVKCASRLELEAGSLKLEIVDAVDAAMKRHATEVVGSISQLLEGSELASAVADLSARMELVQNTAAGNTSEILRLDAVIKDGFGELKEQFIQKEHCFDAVNLRSVSNAARYEEIIKNLLLVTDNLVSNLTAVSATRSVEFTELGCKLTSMDSRITSVQKTVSATMHSVAKTVTRMNEVINKIDNFKSKPAIFSAAETVINSLHEDLALVKECMTLVVPHILGIEQAVSHVCGVLHPQCHELIPAECHLGEQNKTTHPLELEDNNPPLKKRKT